MPATALVSVEEYLRTSYRPDCEYLDGVLLERNVGQYDHGRLQARLTIFLGNRESQWRVRVVTETRVQVKANRFRVPDLCVVKTDAPVEQILAQPPFLCIEILSPDDTQSEMQDRIDDYLAMGVPSVWLLDPRRRRAYIYTASGMHEVKDGVLRASDTDIAVPLAELFD